jgi:hypothetical protein
VTGTDTVIPAVTGNTSITIVASAAVAFQVIAPASVPAGTPFTDSCAKNLTFQPRKDKPAAAKND